MDAGRDFVARIGGVTFFGQPEHGGDRYGFGVAEISGLNSGTKVRRTVEQLPGHGDVGTRGTRAGRVIELAGEAVAATFPELRELQDAFNGILADGEAGTLTIDHMGRTRSCVVELAEPVFDPYGYIPEARFSLQLVAHDGRLYGDARTVSGPSGASLELVNRGNFPAPVRVTVTGNMPAGYGVWIGGQAATFNALNGTDVLDFEAGTVLRNGGIPVGAIRSWVELSVPPGLTTLTLAAQQGSGTVTAAWRDTYM